MSRNGSHGKSRGKIQHRYKTNPPSRIEIEAASSRTLTDEEQIVVDSARLEVRNSQIQRFYNKWGENPRPPGENK